MKVKLDNAVSTWKVFAGIKCEVTVLQVMLALKESPHLWPQDPAGCLQEGMAQATWVPRQHTLLTAALISFTKSKSLFPTGTIHFIWNNGLLMMEMGLSATKKANYNNNLSQNADQNYFEVPRHTSQNGHHQ